LIGGDFMKNFSFMKIFVISVIFASAMIFSANCSALDYQSASVSDIIQNQYDRSKGIVGNWYDESGNLIFKISSDYTINGCKILELKIGIAEDLTGYKCKISEKTGVREINFYHLGEDWHEMLFYDGNSVVYKFPKKYIESVEGIYLGMKKAEVLKILGNPSEIKTYSDNHFVYKNKNIEVWFFENVFVSAIRIDRNSDNFSRFFKKYKFLATWNPEYIECEGIGHGEYIVTSRNGISLSLGYHF